MSLPRQIRNPLGLLRNERVEAARVADPMANFASLATSNSAGEPKARVVTIREIRDDTIVLSANLQSPKVQELRETNAYELLIYWTSSQIQFRISGNHRLVTYAEEVELARNSSRMGRLWNKLYESWPQSSELHEPRKLFSRLKELERQEEPIDTPLAGFVSLEPTSIELQVIDPIRRFHDRRLLRLENGIWSQTQLVP